MHAIVISESVYGNTELVAEAIGEGLETGGTVEVYQVADAPRQPTCDLLVVGGPTHAFSMSSRNSRTQAVERQNAPSLVSYGIRDWLEDAELAPGQKVATFDTKLKTPKLPGSAAKAAMKRLTRAGCVAAAPPESFWVVGGQGPLVEGEQQRALAWGERLASTI